MHFSTLHYALDDNKTMTLTTTKEALASAALYIYSIYFIWSVGL